MVNNITLEGYIAHVGEISKSGKLMFCTVAWHRKRDNGEEDTVFLPVWFWLNKQNEGIGKGDRVVVIGEIRQQGKAKGHKTYIFGRLIILWKKHENDVELPPLEEELPF